MIDELERKSAVRLQAADHQGERSTGVVMMMFDSAPEVPNADDARSLAPAAHHEEHDRRG